MSRFNTLRPFALLACLALLLAAVGCNGDSVVAPVDGPGSVATEPALYGISSTPEDPVLSEGKVRGAMISAEFGGKVTNGRITLEFPAGALDQDTYITMEMVDKTNLVVEFGPEGIVFNERVTMTMKLDGTTAENLAEVTLIKYYNPTTSEWENIENLPVQNPNKVSALLEHFCKYGADVGG